MTGQQIVKTQTYGAKGKGVLPAEEDTLCLSVCQKMGQNGFKIADSHLGMRRVIKE